VINPPIKGWLMINVVDYGILFSKLAGPDWKPSNLSRAPKILFHLSIPQAISTRGLSSWDAYYQIY
jgi:hypothetical protein